MTTPPPVGRRRAAIALVAIAALVVISAGPVRRAVEERRRETILEKARLALETDPTAAVAWLASYPADAPGWDAARSIALEARRRGVARHVFALPGGRRPEALAFDGDGEHVAAFVGGRLAQWDLGTGASTRDVAVGSDGPAAFLGGTGSLVVATAGGALDLVPASGASRRLGDVGGPVRALVASASGKWVTAAGDGAFTIASASGTVHRRIAAPEGRVAAMTLAPDGARLAAVLDQSAWVYDLGSGRGHALEGRVAKLLPILFVHGREPRLLAVGDDGALSLWSLPSGDPRRLPGGARPVVALAVSTDGARAATADEAGDLRVWDMASGEAHLLGTHPGRVTALELSGGGELLASAREDGTVLLWDVATSEHEALRARGGVGAPLVFSRDGRWLATGGGGEIRVWAARPPADDALQPDPAGVRAALSRWTSARVDADDQVRTP